VEDIQQALAVVAVLIVLVTSLFVLRSKGIVRFAIQGKLASNTRRMRPSSACRLPRSILCIW
jgi:hypothetical protein